MAIYQLKLRTTAGALTNKPCWGLLTNATNKVKVLDLRINLGFATASEFSLGIAATVGTQTGGVGPQQVQPLVVAGAAGTSRITTAWSVDPGVPTSFIDGVSWPATVGSFYPFALPFDGLIVPVSSELVLWNTGASTNATITHFTVLLEELS